MAGEPLARRDRGGPEIIELGLVPGFVVFDLPGAPVSAGGTRLVPDVSVAEVALLARAMTYKFAALGERGGGAKAGVRGDPGHRGGEAVLMARVRAGVGPLVAAGRCLPDAWGLGVGLPRARRRVAGEACVPGWGGPAGPRGQLFAGVGADVVAPGTGRGVMEGGVAGLLPWGVRVAAPAANAPYTA